MNWQNVMSFVIAFIFSLIISVILFYYFMVRKFNRCIYVYNREERWTPAPEEYYEYNIFIPGTIDQYINCWRSAEMVPEKDTLVFFHGTGQNKSLSKHIFLMSKILNMNFAAFDYRMYGKSSIDLRSNILTDADVFIEDLSHVTEPSKMILWAESLGGACAIHMANKKNFKYLILCATFSSIADIIRYRSRNFRLVHQGFKFLFNTFPSVDKVPGIQTPVLLIHSTSDETVPYVCSEIIYEKLTCTKKLISITGSHVKPILEQSKIKEILEFMGIEYTPEMILELLEIMEERNKTTVMRRH